MGNTIDFEEKKYVREQMEKSGERYSELVHVVVAKTMELSDFVKEEVRKQRLLVTEDTFFGSSKLITSSLLIRAACDELLRLASDQEGEHKICHHEAKTLGIDLFSQYYDEAHAHHKALIKDSVNQLFSILQESKLTEAVGKKETESNEHIKEIADRIRDKGEL